MPSHAEQLAPWVGMALASVGREYPVHLPLMLESAADLGLPRSLTPAFFGSYDWHSAVHGHWCLARAARLEAGAGWAGPARAALARSLTAEHLAREHAFVSSRPTFERPYGLAWLLQLAAELRAWQDDEARAWGAALAPLESVAAQRLVAWSERLPYPVRSGEHSQSAFAIGLALDWARDARDRDAQARLAARALALHGGDRAAPLAYEPSGHDFLSPVLGAADLLRRVMAPEAFARWLSDYLPAPDAPALDRWLEPVTPPDRADGKFAHLDGLNLSRAWMLEGVVVALPAGHGHRDRLADGARRQRAAGLAGALGTHYAGTHWLGSFAVYLLTGRGLG